MKTLEFANSIDPNKMAHNEPSYQVYTVCPLFFVFSIIHDTAWTKHIFKFFRIIMSRHIWVYAVCEFNSFHFLAF